MTDAMQGSVPSSPQDSWAQSIDLLLHHCEQADWAGCDPYDALNSTVFARTPLARSRTARIAFTQALKRLPIDIRPVLGISHEQNPKALGLFLTAVVKLRRCGMDQEGRITALASRIAALRAPGSSYSCWGYSFPWQTRTVLVPRGSPNIVCTTFVANALLDSYADTGVKAHLQMARSAGEYILDELYWSQRDVAGFSYPLPGSHTRIHNANFLGAALLCRLYAVCGEERFLQPALNVARYSASKQQPDGSWPYGELTSQRWIDNFHTGYNLCALRDIGRYGGTAEFGEHVARGFRFYQQRFFTAGGIPRYYHDRTYPIDIHSAAQSIITMVTLRDLDSSALDVARHVCAWTMRSMLDRQGYYYYQVHRVWTNRISYMRWSQSWMLVALATLLDARGTGHGAAAQHLAGSR